MQALYSVPKGEYLYTAGQPTAMYLIASGEFRIYTIEQVIVLPRDPNDTEREVVSRKVELQILKAHDIAGVSEVCYYCQRNFSSYCVATASSMVYELPIHATLSIIKPSTATFQALVEYFKHQQDWYKLRRFTALNRYNQATEYPLTSAMQRKSPLQCPRCGQIGHLSDSTRCSQQDTLPHQVLHQREKARQNRLRALQVEERGPSLPIVYHIPPSVKAESRFDKFLHRLDAALGFNKQLARQAN
ncbi:hypothetical protein THRCLA_11542 [Thraustotheca clavata]|uniref:Cyclic nucleotide-binding domain-containing protein n=1 Tax=Thraustotheca clavata TaxID=74557 RepID=A0A1V9Y7G3_9STRA|nr:hypothetical protein THRCLA_11542 [Thraustotheca clavata]